MVHAASLPGEKPIADLERTRDWIVDLGGEELKGAEVFYSDYEVAWVLRLPGLRALMLSPRGDNSVQRIDEKVFAKTAGVGASLSAGGSQDVVAQYSRSGGEMSFELDGHTYSLRPAPPVLGHRSASDVGERHPAFVPAVAAYREKAGARMPPMSKAATEEVTVRVYFGSWSPICERIVPKTMAVEEAWKRVRFEYYGLPQPLTDDPHAVTMKLTGVPTVVILRGGEEVERLAGRRLDQPETAIAEALADL